MCGAPGVGKTAIYAEVLSRWKKNQNWVPGDHLYPYPKVKFSAPSALVQSLVQKIRRVPDAGAMKKAGEAFVIQNPAYVDACWNNLFFNKRSGPDQPDLRFHAADYWFKTFQKIQILRQHSSSKLALIDEGLIQRIDSAIFESKTWEEEKDEIARLLNIMVLPNALIYIETDTKENVSRLKKRKKMLTLHKNLSEKKLEEQVLNYQRRWNFVHDLLKQTTVHVLRIDAADSIQKNAATILRFLEEFDGTAVSEAMLVSSAKQEK